MLRNTIVPLYLNAVSCMLIIMYQVFVYMHIWVSDSGQYSYTILSLYFRVWSQINIIML